MMRGSDKQSDRECARDGWPGPFSERKATRPMLRNQFRDYPAIAAQRPNKFLPCWYQQHSVGMGKATGTVSTDHDHALFTFLQRQPAG